MLSKTYIHLHLLAFRTLPYLLLLVGCQQEPRGLEIDNNSAQPTELAKAIIAETAAQIDWMNWNSANPGPALDLSGWRLTMTFRPGDRCPDGAVACADTEGRGISSPFPEESDRWPVNLMAGVLAHELMHAYLQESLGNPDKHHVAQHLFDLNPNVGLCGRVATEFGGPKAVKDSAF